MNKEFNSMSDTTKKIVAYADDVIISYWGETSSCGMKVKFLLPSNTKTHPFKIFTTQDKNKGGQRFLASFTPVIEIPEDGRTPVIDPNPALRKKINVEMILTHWGETATSGRSVTFLVQPEVDSDEHPFSPFDVGKGKKQGQKFVCALVQLNDDESAVIQNNDESTRDRDRLEDNKENNVSKDSLSGVFIKKSSKESREDKKDKKKIPFNDWLPSRQSGYLCNQSYFKSFLFEEYTSYSEYSTDTADTIRKIFRIASRKELNEDPLRKQWDSLIEKYNAWINKQESW